MRPSTAVEISVTLISLLAGTALSIPTPWSESLLEDINNMRANGLSEAEIGLRYPRALFYPNPTSPAAITLYSPPDLRTYSHSSHDHIDDSVSSSNRRPGFMARLAHKLGLHLGGQEACDNDDDGGDGDVFWDLVNEEDQRQAKGRLREGVGKRGGEMGRMEVVEEDSE